MLALEEAQVRMDERALERQLVGEHTRDLGSRAVGRVTEDDALYGLCMALARDLEQAFDGVGRE